MIRVNLVIKKKGDSLYLKICDVNINYMREDMQFFFLRSQSVM